MPPTSKSGRIRPSLALLSASVVILAACCAHAPSADNETDATGESHTQTQPNTPDGSSSSLTSGLGQESSTTNTPTMKPEDSAETSAQPSVVASAYNELNRQEKHVILNKGTDRPSDDGLTLTHDPGTYLCRQCNAQLYRAEDKFDSHCGWPSFDDEIEGAVHRHVDADGRRIEIVCANCEGHLGHVFEGERKTAKNVRHCVNSSSMQFIAEGKEIPAKIVLSE